MSILISAVVCTLNRAAYLSKALQSLACQTLDPALYEVIVVDNGSTDNTRDIFNAYTARPNWRYLVEPVLGLSRARNTGWRNAYGTYIAYLDDDAVACPEWLENIINVFETFTPSPASVGGRSEPIWETPRPEWLSNKMLGCLSLVHWSDIPLILNENQYLPGCNISYKRNLLQDIGGFSEDLGRKGSSLLGSEEIFARDQLDDRGLISVYHPNISVYHHVSASRLTKKWFRKRAYWQGISDVVRLSSGQCLSFRFRIKLALKRVGWVFPRFLLMLTTINSAARFRRQYQVLEAIGYISGIWQRKV